MADEQPTWSVVADKMGGHWHATVRRGIEGSRAKLGELAFDLSDVEDVKRRIYAITDQIAIQAMTTLLHELNMRDLIRQKSYGERPTAEELEEIVRGETRTYALDLVVAAFGVRVDLAKVGG